MDTAMTLSINNPAAQALWARQVDYAVGGSSIFLPKFPEPTPEEKAQREREHVEWERQQAVDAAKVPAFLAALDALCREHGVTIKAKDYGGGYEGDLFTASLGAATIERITAGFDEENDA